MTTLKKTLDSTHGFLTAFWASFGVAILGAALIDEDPVQFLSEYWLVAVMFVLTIYGSSYLLGMRAFAFEKVKTNPFLSVLAAFLVSELVLGFGVFAGGLGNVILEVVRGNFSQVNIFEDVIGMTGGFMMFGVMFTTPLALGLGLNVWIREWLLAKKSAREAMDVTDIMS